ncbi:hypothetical protein BpHYR1_045493 [Brachionus plicatilis]|uniref:Uncharacterized protein n=1 Tax=Brachionus plicatilis TaxID=10195 RepID=A0A3M7QA04_BRAPC|nr:hypothetical protein BpHYR1_045493 [Brachionus plicatilis]
MQVAKLDNLRLIQSSIHKKKCTVQETKRNMLKINKISFTSDHQFYLYKRINFLEPNFIIKTNFQINKKIKFFK